jgi:hypothetical protein
MKEAATDAGNTMVLSGQQAGGLCPVSRSPLSACEPAGDLHAIGASNNCEDGKATVDPDEPSALVLRSMLMAPAGMEGRSFDVQAHLPSGNPPGDRRGQDSGARSHHASPGRGSRCLMGRSIRRSRRVSSCTRMVPILGRVTDRGCPSPTRIPSRPLGSLLFRRRSSRGAVLCVCVAGSRPGPLSRRSERALGQGQRRPPRTPGRRPPFVRRGRSPVWLLSRLVQPGTCGQRCHSSSSG